MIKILHTTFLENKFYGISFFAWLLVGGLLLFLNEKGDLILFFNDHRSYSGDLFFRYATKLGEEITYLLILIFFLIYRRKAAWLIPVSGVLVLLISKGLKEFFKQDRPIAWFKKQDLFEVLNLIDGVPLLHGASSFPSGHTMSAFALFGLLALLVPQKKGIGILILGLAILVGFSRVYLIHHFFLDIYVGSILGTLLALIIYTLWVRVQPEELRA